MDDALNFDEYTKPEPESAVYGLTIFARKAPKLWKKDRLDKDDEKEFWTRQRQANVAAGFALDALQRHFREGVPTDADAEFYAGIDAHNASEVDNLYYGKKASFWIGHKTAYVTLIFNLPEPRAGCYHGFQVDAKTPKVMIDRAQELSKWLALKGSK